MGTICDDRTNTFTWNIKICCTCKQPTSLQCAHFPAARVCQSPRSFRILHTSILQSIGARHCLCPDCCIAKLSCRQRWHYLPRAVDAEKAQVSLMLSHPYNNPMATRNLRHLSGAPAWLRWRAEKAMSRGHQAEQWWRRATEDPRLGRLACPSKQGNEATGWGSARRHKGRLFGQRNSTTRIHTENPLETVGAAGIYWF